jgi:hydroxyethylthiazole kinase-like uncharacterized protein yjeF
MRAVFTPEQMAQADRAAIEGGTPSLDLMERAGRAVAQAAMGLAGGSYGKRIVIVCGKGNNAGDGFVAARHLDRAGAFPVVVCLEEPEGLSGDARVNFERLEGIRIVRFDLELLRKELRRASAAVDALVGTGFRGALEGPMAEAAETLNRSRVPVVSVDIPSGVDGTTGRVEGPAVRANITVTMAAPKPGHLFWPGSEHAGEVEVADIGIEVGSVETGLYLVASDDVRSVIPARGPDSDKRSVGTVLVIAGSVGMGGAAALVAKGALRSGAGLVTVAAPESLARTLHQVVNEGTTLPLPETGAGTVGAEALPVVIERASRFDAVAIGPGMSRDPETVEFIRKAVTEIERPMVIDADAVNAFAGEPEALSTRAAATVITPHIRELSRLLDVPAETLEGNRVEAARDAARRTESVVVLKGFRTLVASPSGAVWVIPVGGPVLATGGSGDVLTGIVGTFLASLGPESDDQEAAPSAALAAAWIHGRCGDLQSALRGERGVIAGDLTEVLPEVIRLVREGP